MSTGVCQVETWTKYVSYDGQIGNSMKIFDTYNSKKKLDSPQNHISSFKIHVYDSRRALLNFHFVTEAKSMPHITIVKGTHVKPSEQGHLHICLDHYSTQSVHSGAYISRNVRYGSPGPS